MSPVARLASLDTKVIYLAGVLGALAVIGGIAVLFPYGIYNLKCERFDLPELEKAFGFQLGQVEDAYPNGATYTVLAVARVEPKGLFATAGFRPGDVPRTHHGISEFCGDLGAALEGRPVEVSVYNVHDSRAGAEPIREVRLGGKGGQ